MRTGSRFAILSTAFAGVPPIRTGARTSSSGPRSATGSLDAESAQVLAGLGAEADAHLAALIHLDVEAEPPRHRPVEGHGPACAVGRV